LSYNSYISSHEADNFIFFTRALHSWKTSIICLTRWNITVIRQEKWNILYIYIYIYIYIECQITISVNGLRNLQNVLKNRWNPLLFCPIIISMSCINFSPSETRTHKTVRQVLYNIAW